VTTRETVTYTVAQTILYGAFVSWLASSEVIVGTAFGREDLFPVVFGGLAAVMGAAMLVNGRIVERIGTRRLADGVLHAYVVVAAVLALLAVVTDGTPPLVLFVVAMAAMISAHALLIPNFNTLAMAPMAAVAGTASSVIGAAQLAGGSLIGAWIDSRFDGTIRPLALSFLAAGVAAALLVRLAREQPALPEGSLSA
jgi:MFS transporter, DHA1 family, multidrug resistance protein